MDNYLIEKKPMRALLLFALPIIIGNLFQQTYTMADSAIVGRFVGEQALAAVGASYSLTNIFICIALGGGIGASVIVSRYYGAQRYAAMKQSVYTALFSFLAVSVLLGSVGLLAGEPIMLALNTPSDVLQDAVDYLNIYFLGLPFLFMYNILSAMFNALGKSRIPLAFLIFSSLLNIVLDWYMVVGLGMGVTGVAWATLLAQGLSAVLSFFVFLRLLSRLHGKPRKRFDGTEFLTMGKIALPSILQQSTVSIGMMLVQSVVNGFGSQALAGFSAGMRIESLCIVPMTGLGNALSSYTAQNIGAGRQERVVEGYHATNWMVIFFGAVICIALQCFNRPIISFFLASDASAVSIATGRNLLRFMGWFFSMIGFKMAVDGLLRGAGDMKMFTLANLVNLGLRVALAVILAPRFGIEMVWYAVPVGWFVNWAISFMQYRTGKWRRIYKVQPQE